MMQEHDAPTAYLRLGNRCCIARFPLICVGGNCRQCSIAIAESIMRLSETVGEAGADLRLTIGGGI